MEPPMKPSTQFTSPYITLNSISHNIDTNQYIYIYSLDMSQINTLRDCASVLKYSGPMEYLADGSLVIFDKEDQKGIKSQHIAVFHYDLCQTR
jgi:hypothetical protein